MIFCKASFVMHKSSALFPLGRFIYNMVMTLFSYVFSNMSK